jgi:peroxiredoxin Q/BCP
MSQLRQHIADYERLDTQVLGITPQNPDFVRDYASANGITFPLLIDPDRTVTRLYGVYNLISREGINLPHNSTFLIDRAGIIRFVHVGLRSTDVPDEAALRALLATLV